MMIQAIKDEIWRLVQTKKIALFMIFSADGEILWHRGRLVTGRTIAGGSGFCRSYCLEALKKVRQVKEKDCLVGLNGDPASESALLLRVRQLLVFPISSELFFYLDSGGKVPFSEDEVLELKALGRIFARLMAEIKKREKGSEGFSGNSQAAELIRTRVRKYAIVEEPVLLLGETGVGKNRAAELIHRYSGRQGSFVHVHTPGVTRELFESQLFGHRKGSFTGATNDTFGFVAAAEGGTLFLDEIADLSPDVQAKLLRLIDAKTYTRLGEASERQADVRIVAATNKDLKRWIGEELFRDDLYFRLNVLPITIPPLRERREDIRDLLDEFAGKLKGKILGREAVRVLTDYSWPGNIRELKSVLTRAGINHDGPKIGPEIADFFEKGFPFSAPGSGNDKLDQIWMELKDGRTFWEAVKDPFMKRNICREDVKSVVRRAMNERKGKGYMKDCLPALNIPFQEFKKYLDFMRDYKIF